MFDKLYFSFFLNINDCIYLYFRDEEDETINLEVHAENEIQLKMHELVSMC